MSDGFAETTASSVARYRVRKKGCLPVRSGNIQLRRHFRPPQKYSSNPRRLPQIEPCNLSPVPATNPSDEESEFGRDSHESTPLDRSRPPGKFLHPVAA